MSNTLKVSGRNHYGLSAVAAVIYAIAWLVVGRAHAAASTETPMLAAVVVTASRPVEAAMLEPIIVVGQREVSIESYATLAPILVEATRYAVNTNSTQLPSTLANTAMTAGNTQHVVKISLASRVGRWLTASLIK